MLGWWVSVNWYFFIIISNNYNLNYILAYLPYLECLFAGLLFSKSTKVVQSPVIQHFFQLIKKIPVCFLCLRLYSLFIFCATSYYFFYLCLIILICLFYKFYNMLAIEMNNVTGIIVWAYCFHAACMLLSLLTWSLHYQGFAMPIFSTHGFHWSVWSLFRGLNHGAFFPGYQILHSVIFILPMFDSSKTILMWAYQTTLRVKHFVWWRFQTLCAIGGVWLGHGEKFLQSASVSYIPPFDCIRWSALWN